MTPLVSLLVPAYNRADLLGPCLDSALAQTSSDLEVVLVDGASTDDTWKVCERYAAADARVRAIREDTNTGPVGGWTRCLAEARGTYGTFLWSDDLLMPTFLERTLPLLVDPKVGFAFTAVEIGSMPGKGVVAYSHESRRIPSPVFIRGELLGGSQYPVSPACGLFRLEDLRAGLTATLPTEPVTDLAWTGAGTDLMFFLSTATRYPMVACIEEPLAFFRAHPGSLSVHGRGGLIALHYALTKAWFARGRGQTGIAARVLARHWLRDMAARRRIVTPSAAVERYVGLVTKVGLLAGAGTELIHAPGRHLASLLRR
jgi:hypothetical protein